MNVTLPRQDIPLSSAEVITRDWYRWARDITERAGGTTGVGTGELSASQFEDAGIEEVKAQVYQLRGVVEEAIQMRGQIDELRGLVASLQRELAGIQQGVTQ